MNIDMKGAVLAFAGFGLDALNEELALAGIPEQDDEAVAVKLVIGSNQIRSQGEIAALAVNLSKGSVTPAELNDIFAAVFPAANLGKGRHGPHWLCHVRNGNIVGYQPRYYAPKMPERKLATKFGMAATGHVDVDSFRSALSEARTAFEADAEPEPEPEPETKPKRRKAKSKK